jgi:type 1 glutamine amidotransferase
MQKVTSESFFRENRRMIPFSSRREFLRVVGAAGAGMALANPLLGVQKKSVLLFTKSSAWEHDVVKNVGGKPSTVERAIRGLGAKNGFEVTATKDGRILESDDLYNHDAFLFFTSGDLTKKGTDGNWPMSALGKQGLLEAIEHGKGFAGVHAAADTFHTQPDPPDRSNRYIAHGEKSDPYLRMLGGEYIIHARDEDPRLQTAKVIVNDAKFPGLEGVASPFSFMEEWGSLKDFVPDIHVILTLDTHSMHGECYQRAPYPVTWTRQHGQGRVFYSSMGDRPETWEDAFFLNLLAGGIRWAIRAVDAQILPNLQAAAPGYAEIPPKSPPED